MEPEIHDILSDKRYQDLQFPFNVRDRNDLRHKKKLHERVILYCDLLMTLLNDRNLWKKHEIPERIFHSMRLRYSITGNVLKAIFLIHEKHKEAFLKFFKTEYVKTFTFSQTGKKVKIIVASPSRNGQDDQRPPILDISVTPSRSHRIVIPSIGDFEALRNIQTSRSSRRVPSFRQDTRPVDVNAIEVEVIPDRPIDVIPMNVDTIPVVLPDPPIDVIPMNVDTIPVVLPDPSRQDSIRRVVDKDIYAIEVVQDEPESNVGADRSGAFQPVASTSSRIDGEEFTREYVEKLLGELGLPFVPENLQRIKSHQDLNNYVNECYGSEIPGTFQVVDVEPPRRRAQVPSSDDITDIPVFYERHPLPDQQLDYSQNVEIVKERRAVFKEQNLFLNEAPIRPTPEIHRQSTIPTPEIRPQSTIPTPEIRPQSTISTREIERSTNDTCQIEVVCEMHPLPDEQLDYSQNVEIVKARRAVFKEQNLFLNEAPIPPTPEIHRQSTIPTSEIQRQSTIPTRETERSTNDTCQIQVACEMHPPREEEIVITYDQCIEMVKARRAVFNEQNLFLNQAQMRPDLSLPRVDPSLDHPRRLQVQASPEPMTAFEERAAGLRKLATPTQPPHLDLETGIPIMETLFIDEHQHIPITPIAQNIGTKEMAVERREEIAPEIRDRAASNVTPRLTIAEMLIQSGARPTPPEVERALGEQSGPYFRLAHSDAPYDIVVQDIRQPSPLIRLGDVLEEPVKKTPAKRNKYCFHSREVMSRKFKNVQPPDYVSHIERMRKNIEGCRDPRDSIASFDRYELPGDAPFRFGDRFQESFEDEAPNLMANMLSQLFEHTDEDDSLFDEENETEMRVERLQRSIIPEIEIHAQQEELHQSRILMLEEIEEANRLSLRAAHAERQSLFQVPVPETPRPSARISTILDISLLPTIERSIRAPGTPPPLFPAAQQVVIPQIAAEMPILEPRPAMQPHDIYQIIPEMPIPEPRPEMPPHEIPQITAEMPILQPRPEMLPLDPQIIPEMPILEPRPAILPQEIPQLAAEMPILQPRPSMLPLDPQIIPEMPILEPRPAILPQEIPQITAEMPILQPRPSMLPLDPQIIVEMPILIPRPSIPEVTATTRERMERDRIDLEEIIPQKKIRKTPPQAVIDVSQIPAELHVQPMPALEDHTMERRFAEFQQQTRPSITVEGRVPRLSTLALEARQGVFQPSAGVIEQEVIPPPNGTAQEQEEPETIPTRRSHITKEIVLDQLTTLWMERHGEGISFTDLCPKGITKKVDAAKTFSVLLNLSFMKMAVLDQESSEQWPPPPETVKISPPQ